MIIIVPSPFAKHFFVHPYSPVDGAKTISKIVIHLKTRSRCIISCSQCMIDCSFVILKIKKHRTNMIMDPIYICGIFMSFRIIQSAKNFFSCRFIIFDFIVPHTIDEYYFIYRIAILRLARYILAHIKVNDRLFPLSLLGQPYYTS